jgi:polyphosphate kinase
VELLFPIDDAGLRRRIHDEILAVYLSDTEKARRIKPDGSYQRLKWPGSVKGRSSQEALMLASQTVPEHSNIRDSSQTQRGRD